MKVLGFYAQPKWASRPLVWVYQGVNITRKYNPTRSSRNRIARLLRNPAYFPQVVRFYNGKHSHVTIFRKSDLEAAS